jgi:hypothetical protein
MSCSCSCTHTHPNDFYIDAEQTSWNDGSADEYSQRPSTLKPPANTSGRQRVSAQRPFQRAASPQQNPRTPHCSQRNSQYIPHWPIPLSVSWAKKTRKKKEIEDNHHGSGIGKFRFLLGSVRLSTVERNLSIIALFRVKVKTKTHTKTI